MRRRSFRFALVLASALPAFAVVSAANADRPGWPIPGTPKIVGTAQVGATVTGDVGSIYCDPRCTYALGEWLSCAGPSAGGADVPSAPAGEANARAAGCRVAWPFPALSTYVVGPEDQGRYIQYHVIAENAECDEEGDCTTADAHGYSPTLGPVAAAPVTPVALPRNTSPPSITGLAEDMQTLTASPGTWTATAALAYQWQRCATTVESCRAIAGATGLRYHVARADIGARLSVAVTASGIGGTATASTALTAPVGRARPRPGHDVLSIGELLPADGLVLKTVEGSRVVQGRLGVLLRVTVTDRRGFLIDGASVEASDDRGVVARVRTVTGGRGVAYVLVKLRPHRPAPAELTLTLTASRPGVAALTAARRIVMRVAR